MLKTNHFERFFNQLIYGVRQLGNVSNLTERCSDMSRSAGNQYGGSDKYSSTLLEYSIALHKIFEPGLIKKQHGGKIPIGSH